LFFLLEACHLRRIEGVSEREPLGNAKKTRENKKSYVFFFFSDDAREKKDVESRRSGGKEEEQGERVSRKSHKGERREGGPSSENMGEINSGRKVNNPRKKDSGKAEKEKKNQKRKVRKGPEGGVCQSAVGGIAVSRLGRLCEIVKRPRRRTYAQGRSEKARQGKD